MKRFALIAALALLLFACLGYAAWRYFSIAPVSAPPATPAAEPVSFLTLPEGFEANVFWAGERSTLSLPGPNAGPRMMIAYEDGILASLTRQGAVVALKDVDRDGVADSETVFISGLKNPHGLATAGGWVYIAEEHRVIRVRDDDRNLEADPGTLEALVDLPAGGHFTRTIKIIDDKLFVSIGSSCNVCHEADERRATIQRCDADGKNCALFARGLRNTVDFIEKDGRIYGVDNGRDRLGNDLPPDELNIIAQGGNYGWPVCYGANIHDTEFDKNIYIRNPCMEPFETSSFVDLPAHVAPLGLAFYEGGAFPAEYADKLFISYHGSWDANPPVGYKVVAVDLANKTISDFITGFRSENGTVYGRPVGIINFAGGLLISDDAGGAIYRVSYRP